MLVTLRGQRVNSWRLTGCDFLRQSSDIFPALNNLESAFSSFKMYFQVLKEMKTFRDIDLDTIMVNEKYEISTFQK